MPSVQRGGGSAPQPPSCPISLPWPPGTSPPPPRRGTGAPTVSATLALPGASAPCGGTCLRSPLRPPRGFAACPPPPARPLARDAPAAAGRSVCLSVSPCIWEVLLLEIDFLTLLWLCDLLPEPVPQPGSVQLLHPEPPQSRGGFPDPHKGYEGHGTPAAQGGPWDAVAAWHTFLLEIGRFL